MTRHRILQILSEYKAELERYGVERLAVFGSAARDELGPDSDVDLLVEFNRPVGLFEFVRLQQYIEDLLGQSVDLVTPDALEPGLRKAVTEEAVRA